MDEPVLLDTPTIDGLVRAAADRAPDKVFLVDGTQRVTFGAFDHFVDAVAGGLIDLGIKPGDRVAIWMQNCIEWATSFCAIVRVGAIAVPMNTELQPDEAEYIVRHSGAVALVAPRLYRGRDFSALAAQLQARIGPELKIVLVGDEGNESGSGVRSYNDLLHSEPPGPRQDERSVQSPTFILYTSGTTGRPKGVVHTHRFVPVMIAAGKRMRLTEDDAVVLYLPLYHIYGLVAGLLLFLSAQAKIVLMPSFNAHDSLELIERERATIVYGVPTTYIDQLADPDIDRFDTASVRLAFAPFGAELSKKVASRFGATANVFGMTETAAITLLPPLDDDPERMRSTVGTPIEGMEARIVDDAGSDVGDADSPGELLVRGPAVLDRYFDDPAATSKAIDADGWFHTGDLAVYDDARRIRFIGRRGDMLRVGGELVDPAEVEAVLERHPAVQRAAVVGIPEERLGEVPYAWIVVHGGSAVDTDEVSAFVADRLARFKRPRQLIVLDSFPTTPSGKIKKFVLKSSMSSIGQT